MKNLNALYNYEAVQDQMRAAFKTSKPSVLMLTDFFDKKFYATLLADLNKIDSKEIYVPHKERYAYIESTDIQKLFSSSEFLDFVRNVTGAKIKSADMIIKKFGQQNYTLLHDDVLANKRLIFFYTLAGKWKSEFGGQTIFTFGDGRAPLVFEPQGNSLCIMLVPEGMRDFVKYIKHFAGESKIVKIEGIFS